MGLKFELKSSRSVHSNRNDEADLKAATTAAGECSKIDNISTVVFQKQFKKEAGVRGAAAPALGG